MDLINSALQRGAAYINEARQASKAPQTLPNCLPPTSTLLIGVPYAELREVNNGLQSLLAEGAFAISSVDNAGRGGDEALIRAEVGGFAWDVQPSTQALRVGELTFVFSTPLTGVCYALTLGADTPPEAVGILEAVLENMALLRESERLLADPAAKAGEVALSQGVEYRHQLARGVRKGSSYVAKGLLVTATCASGALDKAVASRLDKVEPHGAPLQLPSGLHKRLAQTAKAAKWTAKITNKAVEGLVKLGAKAAGKLVRASGVDQKLAAATEQGAAGQPRQGSVLREVSRAAVDGWGEVQESLEQAGHLVLTSARDNTAQVVGCKYGAEAGAASREAMNAMGHTADALLTFNELGLRMLAKATAKQTAKDVMHSWSKGDGAGAGGAQALQH